VPEANRLSGHGDAAFGEKIFNIAETEIEAIVEPDGVGNDAGWKAIAFICIHPPILSISAL
jgi:hypothetical protein